MTGGASLTMWLAVAAGAVVGAPLRAIVELKATEWSTRRDGLLWTRLPIGLLVVNVAGSFIAGVVLVATSGEVRTLLAVGFCGAFTTFSGYGWHAHRSWREDRPAFWLALVLMVGGCLAGCSAGLLLGSLAT